MIRTLKTIILICKMYRCSDASVNDDTEHDNENFTYCQVLEQKRELYSSLERKDKDSSSDQEDESDESETLSNPQTALKYFKLVNSIAKTYRPVYIKIAEAEAEEKDILNTIEALQTSAILKKDKRWIMQYNNKKMNLDPIYNNQRINICCAELKDTLQKIESLLKPIKNDYAYVQLDKKKKIRFQNFTSILWGQEFDQMIKDACGNEFAQKIECEIKKFKASRDKIWLSGSFMDQKTLRKIEGYGEWRRRTDKEEEHLNSKFYAIQRHAFSNNSDIMKIVANKVKLASTVMFSNEQKVKYHKKHYEMRANNIFLTEFVKKQFVCYDFIENTKKFDQDYRLTKDSAQTNEELNKNIKNILTVKYTFLQKEVDIEFDDCHRVDLSKIAELSINMKRLLLEKLETIEEQLKINIQFLENDYDREKDLNCYKEVDNQKEILDARIKILEEFEEDRNKLCVTETKNKYIDRLKNDATISKDFAENIINTIIDAIYKPYKRKKKIKYIISEMEKNWIQNRERIFWSIADEYNYNSFQGWEYLPKVDDSEVEFITENEMLIDLVEQLVLKNLKKIENNFELAGFVDNKSKTKIKILRCNLKFKSPIYVGKNIFEATNEICNIIHEILTNEILVDSKNRKDIRETHKGIRSELHNIDLEIFESNNVFCFKDKAWYLNDTTQKFHHIELYWKYVYQLKDYWKIIYDNTAASCYKTNKYKVKSSVEKENEKVKEKKEKKKKEKYHNFDLDSREYHEEEKLCFILQINRIEIIFSWFFFLMRTYTFYLTDALVDFKKIPHEKLDELLLEYNIWEIFVESAYKILQNNYKDYGRRFLSFYDFSCYAKSGMKCFFNNYLKEVDLLLLYLIVSEEGYMDKE